MGFQILGFHSRTNSRCFFQPWLANLRGMGSSIHNQLVQELPWDRVGWGSPCFFHPRQIATFLGRCSSDNHDLSWSNLNNLVWWMRHVSLNHLEPPFSNVKSPIFPKWFPMLNPQCEITMFPSLNDLFPTLNPQGGLSQMSVFFRCFSGVRSSRQSTRYEFTISIVPRKVGPEELGYEKHWWSDFFGMKSHPWWIPWNPMKIDWALTKTAQVLALNVQWMAFELELEGTAAGVVLVLLAFLYDLPSRGAQNPRKTIGKP